MSDHSNIEQFRKAQNRITTAACKTHGSMAYSAGYFQSMAEQMFAQMTKRQKEQFLRQVEQDANRLEALAQVGS